MGRVMLSCRACCMRRSAGSGNARASYRDLAKLVIAIERHAIHAAPRDHAHQEIPEPITA